MDNTALPVATFPWYWAHNPSTADATCTLCTQCTRRDTTRHKVTLRLAAVRRTSSQSSRLALGNSKLNFRNEIFNHHSVMIDYFTKAAESVNNPDMGQLLRRPRQV
jgi:hypothetical protein